MSLNVYLIVGLGSHSSLVDLLGKYDVLTSVVIVSLGLWPDRVRAGRYFRRICCRMSEGSVPIFVALKAEDLYVFLLILVEGW